MLTPSELESLLGEPGSLPDAQRRPIVRVDRSAGRWNASPPTNGLDREQQFALEAMQRQLAHEASGHLSQLLNQTVAIDLASVEVSRCDAVLVDEPPPACWVELRFDQLAEPMLLAIEHAVLWPLLDRLLGGRGEPSEADHDRPLTEIELRLVARVAESFAAAIQVTWQATLPLNGHVVQVETKSDRLRGMQNDLAIVRTQFVLEPGRDRGRVRLVTGLPDACMLVNRLAELGSVPSHPATSTEPPASGFSRKLDQDTAESILLLTETRMSASELQGLSVGDVILTDKPTSEGMMFRLADGTERKATLGQTHGRKAACIRDEWSLPASDAAPEAQSGS